MIALTTGLGTLTLLLGLSIPDQLPAQDFSELYSLYQNKNFNALHQKIQQISAQYPDKEEIRFFNALFLENGDEAFKIYEQLYPRSVGILRNKLGEKLAQYYYARGFYVRAAEFEKAGATTSTSASGPILTGTQDARTDKHTEIKKVNFIIQVGAFGQEDNARQLQRSLQTQKIISRVVTRMVNGRNLFCVWVDGGNSLDETVQIADKIKDRFKLEYRILEN